jgi:PAS domain S-box-containing protein
MGLPTQAAVLEQLTSRSRVVVFAKCLVGRYLFVSDEWSRLFGRPRADVIGRTDAELFDPVTAAHLVRNDERATRERTTVEVLEEIPVEGVDHVFLTRKFPLFEADAVVGVGGVAIDVTARERAARELERSEQRYRSVVDHTPIAYVAFDPVIGRFTNANERAAQLFGVSLERLLIESPASLSPRLQPNGRASDEAAREHIERVMQGERVVFDWTHLTGAGEPVPCHIWLDCIEDDGGHKLARAFLVDLREINAARREVDRHQAALSQTQALARVGGWELHGDELRGTGETQRAFTTPLPLAHVLERLSSATRVQLERALRAPAAFDLEVELDVATQPRVLRWVGAPVTSGNPRSGWLQDVSTQRLLEARLRQTSKMDAVGRLAGGVAHDFNNMLSAILASSSVLEQRLAAADADVREAVDTIVKASQQAAGLTRQLLAFSRQTPLRRGATPIDDVVRDAVEILGRTIDRRISIEHLAAPTPLVVDVDVSMLKNVFINLGINARDAMPGGGQLKFESREVTLDDVSAAALDAQLEAGRWVSVAVSDTGVGIPAGQLNRIFEPFFTTKETGKGTGLGLATAYATMREHGGALTVESREGRGTCFTLWLPPARRVVVEPELEVRSRPAARRGTLLLVDDERLVRRAASRFLTVLGFTVLEAADGTEAEQVLSRAGRVDLVMLDLIMPGRSAEETFRALRALQPDLPVLLCSGYSPEEVASRLLALPHVGRLQKPWSQRELDAALAKLLPRD